MDDLKRIPDDADGELLLAGILLGLHHLIDQALDDQHIALIELLTGEFATGVRHDHRVQVHVPDEAWIPDLHLAHIPAVEEEFRAPAFCFYCYLCYFCHSPHLRGFSLRPMTISLRLTLFTLVTTNRTPGISPIDRPSLPPIPSISTSSCSSMKLMAPSPTANAVT